MVGFEGSSHGSSPPESRLLLLRLSFWDSLRLFSLLCARPGTHPLINYMSV